MYIILKNKKFSIDIYIVFENFFLFFDANVLNVLSLIILKLKKNLILITIIRLNFLKKLWKKQLNFFIFEIIFVVVFDEKNWLNWDSEIEKNKK